MMKIRLSELREARKLSQQKLAEETGVDQTSISNYEIGKYLPSVGVVVRLAEYFCVSTDYFLGLTDDNAPPREAADGRALYALSLYSSLSDERKAQALGYLERLREEEIK